MITKVSKEAPFQVLTSSFSISPSAEGYTLQISADGKNYSNLFSVPANTTRLVTNVAANSFYRLSGNNSEVVVNWQKSCGGGGSADLTNYYTKEETDERIQEAVSGVSFDGYWTSAETKDYVDASVYGITGDFGALSGIVQEQQEVTSRALNDLNDRVDEISGSSVDLSGYYTSGQTDAAIATATQNYPSRTEVTQEINTAVQNKVSSSTISTIWTGTQAEYNLIDTPDPNTFYVIK